MTKYVAKNGKAEKRRTRDRGNVIDMRGAKKLTEVIMETASGLPPISSPRLGLNAYRMSQGPQRPLHRQTHSTQKKQGTDQFDAPVLRSEESIKKVKFSVLKALHAQSNAGSVNLREVSATLDELLRKP